MTRLGDSIKTAEIVIARNLPGSSGSGDMTAAKKIKLDVALEKNINEGGGGKTAAAEQRQH